MASAPEVPKRSFHKDRYVFGFTTFCKKSVSHRCVAFTWFGGRQLIILLCYRIVCACHDQIRRFRSSATAATAFAQARLFADNDRLFFCINQLSTMPAVSALRRNLRRRAEFVLLDAALGIDLFCGHS